MLVNLLTRILCVYGLLFLPLFYSVQCQCTNGDEETCVWKHDEKSALRWVSKTDRDGVRFIQLTGCEHPDCGIASLVTPWLPPRSSEIRMSMGYRLYGTSAVYLRLYMTTEESSGQHLIFTKEGNYALPYPERWTEKSVVIPATSSRHRLLLKAHTPYKEAFVAVKNIRIGEYEDEEENEIGGEREEESQTEERLKQAGLYSHSSALSPILHGYHLHPYIWLSILLSAYLAVIACLAVCNAVLHRLDDKKEKYE